jgi:hypothetical protein
MVRLAADMYPIGIHETGELFPDQIVTALELGYSKSRISQAVSGQKPIRGLTLYKVTEYRTCSVCQTIKPTREFRNRTWNNYLGHRRGYSSQCKKCLQKIRRKRRAGLKQKDIEKFRKQHRRRNIKTMYGLTEEVYDNMVAAQNNCCAICGDKFIKTPHVDHDHETGKVRGLLCHHCNVSLGGFKTIQNLKHAIEYLETTTCQV